MKSEISIDDPLIMKELLASEGFHFGIGVFETMRLLPSGIEDFYAHMERLKASAKALLITIPLEFEHIEELKRYIESKNILKQNDQVALSPIKVIKLTLIKMGSESRWLVTFRPFAYDKYQFEEGFKLCISEVKRCSTSNVQRHKTLNYGENWLEKQKAIENGYQEVLFLNENKHLTETSASNLFFYKEEKWYTPALECGLLNGIMRQRVIDYFKNRNLQVCEGHYTIEELHGAQHIILSNALMGLMPVKAIESDFYNVNIDHEVINFNAIDPARGYFK